MATPRPTASALKAPVDLPDIVQELEDVNAIPITIKELVEVMQVGGHDIPVAQHQAFPHEDFELVLRQAIGASEAVPRRERS